MSSILRFFVLALSLALSSMATHAHAKDSATEQTIREGVEKLEKPLYSPFIERYVLDEIKQLRIEQAANKNELLQQIVDREHQSVDRAVTYATDTITYFFYLIAAATSVLVVVGWTSIRDIKERVHSLADKEISRIINEYESRLEDIEKQIHQKSELIEENSDEIALTQEIQSLWLRAQQDNSLANKIATYDKIMKLKGDDCEAFTYKADAVLELGEPQWAANLCEQALQIDPDNHHAFYQLGCAHALMENHEDAVSYLHEALKRRENYRADMQTDPALDNLREFQPFIELLTSPSDEGKKASNTNNSSNKT